VNIALYHILTVTVNINCDVPYLLALWRPECRYIRFNVLTEIYTVFIQLWVTC